MRAVFTNGSAVCSRSHMLPVRYQLLGFHDTVSFLLPCRAGGLSMTMQPVWTVLTIAALCANTWQTASAAQLGPYVGGSYGFTDRDFEIGVLDDFTVNGLYDALQYTPITHNPSLDTESSGYLGMLGYRISRHIAIEGMFMDLGEAVYRAESAGTFEGEPTSLDTRIATEASGIGLYVLGIVPVGYRWEFYARAGGQFTSARMRIRLNNLLGETRESASDLVAGVGVAMSLFEIYGARLEYVRVFDAGHESTVEADVDMISLGFIVAF